MAAPYYRWDGLDLILNVRVLPRASRDEIVGVQGSSLKIRLTTPPVDGQANAHLIDGLAEWFDTPKSMIKIIKGEKGRDKCLRLRAPRRLPALLPPPAPERP